MYTHPTPNQGNLGNHGSQNDGQASTAPGAPSGHHPGHAPQALPHQQAPAGPHPPHSPAPGDEGPLLGLRSAIVLMLGVLVATGAGVLTYLAQRDAATAALAGGAAFAGAVLFFHKIIAR